MGPCSQGRNGDEEWKQGMWLRTPAELSAETGAAALVLAEAVAMGV